MTQDIDQVTEEIAAEFAAKTETGVSGLILTTSSMVEFLLQAGLSAIKIEERIGSDSGYVKVALKDDTTFDDRHAPKEVKRLRILYLREQLKCLYRKYPFLGGKKAASRLGIAMTEQSSIYDGLISSGELKFKMSIPTWTTTDKKELLREHFVTD